MMTTPKIYLKPIVNSLIAMAVIVVFWLIDGGEIALLQLMRFVVPYYTLWLLLTLISVKRRRKPFWIIWRGSLTENETFSESNLPYAIIFLVGAVAIFILQHKL